MLYILILCVLVREAQADQKLLYEPMSVPIRLVAGEHAKLEALAVRPNRPGRFPLVVIVHGTPRGTGAEFRTKIARMSPDFYLGPAEAFAKRGYAVVLIMRRGFGRSDGSYAEGYAGGCGNRDCLRVARISAEDVVGAAEDLGQEPWADPDRIVLLGHSTGGLAVVAAAAINPPGVIGILNFAGGRGSDAPDHVCSEDRLVQAFAALGTTARIPALWVYAENDHFFSPSLAQRMFDAYRASGAPARLVMLPPVGTDGHMALRIAPHDVIWPPVEAFLGSLHLPTQLLSE